MKNWAELDKPREKLITYGRRNLTDTELLAILIGNGSKEENVVELARKIWNHVDHDHHKLAKLNLDELCEFHGMGPAKAVRVIAALELGRRRREQKPAARTVLDSSH